MVRSSKDGVAHCLLAYPPCEPEVLLLIQRTLSVPD